MLFINDHVCLVFSGFMFGPTTMVGSWNALLHFTLTMPCLTFKSYWLTRRSSRQKQVKIITFILSCYYPSFKIRLFSSLSPQVQCFQRDLSFWSRRCFCYFSGLLHTFTGHITQRRSHLACTRTSTHSLHTSRSSVSSTACWTQRTRSRCRTSSQLWDSMADSVEQTHVVY